MRCANNDYKKEVPVVICANLVYIKEYSGASYSLTFRDTTLRQRLLV